MDSVVNAAKGIGQIANLANQWADPGDRSKLASALGNSAAQNFENDPSKFIGNSVGTVAPFFVPGGGEAGAAADVARATELAGNAGKVATTATDACKVATTGADSTLGKGVTADGSFLKNVTFGELSAPAQRLVRAFAT